MKKIFIVLLFILTSCGYQPLYKTDQNIKSLNISEVIFSGDQKKIEKWRLEKSIEITRKKSPDLL